MVHVAHSMVYSTEGEMATHFWNIVFKMSIGSCIWAAAMRNHEGRSGAATSWRQRGQDHPVQFERTTDYWDRDE